MLLEFRVKNYKSFVDEMVFSMMPAHRQSGLDYSILKENILTKTYKALSSAVIYGPNAAGKTNIIGAMESLSSIVLRGNIYNVTNMTPDATSAFLEMIPNCDIEGSYTNYSITFIENNMLFKYSLILDLGKFLDSNYPRKVIEEKLEINDKLIFLRNDNLDVNLPSFVKKYSSKSINRISNKTLNIAKDSLTSKELFLTNGFKNIFSQELVSIITNWFQSKFVVILHSDSIRTMRKFVDPKDNTVYIESTLNEAAKAFGINSNALGYIKNGESDDVILCSIFKDKKLSVPAEAFESYGTIRFINEFPLVIYALLNGATLVVDEFDASIHPMALMNIISIFHNDEINKNHAQLIFNTHNPIFLDSSLFRRDEIKFVERDLNTNRSTHYSLSDFKTADGIRKGEDYMNNYFVNRYGAINDVDFTEIVKKIVTNKEEE